MGSLLPKIWKKELLRAYIYNTTKIVILKNTIINIKD